MLKHLTIKDFAVVRLAELEFGPGMTVISGETGAGKSLLVDALGFLSGQRADSGMVRHGAERAELAADFMLASDSPALAWLGDNELDDGNHCQVRRTLRADGGSRAWVNGRPVALAQLTALTSRLVEIHGQHEHQALLSKSSQMELLDAFARNQAECAAVREASTLWAGLLSEREHLTARGDVSDRLQYLQHQLSELEREDLSPQAIETLMASHKRQAHATSLIEGCDNALNLLGGDDAPSLSRQLQQVRSELGRLSGHDARLVDVDGMLEGAWIQVDEALSLLGRVRDDLDADPAQFGILERRLERLYDLARKHRVAPTELEARRDAIVAELDGLRGAGERLSLLAGQIEAARDVWCKAATRLGKTRQRAATSLSLATTALMSELGMSGGLFEVRLEPSGNERPDPMGSERTEFLVAANAGQPPRALRKVASGGELARISLAIEVAALGLDAVPTMVFDEVDSGIGGAVAEIVGRKLRTLGKERQVLCVTHLPQVAAQGHAHYRVSKAPVEGMTQSAVEALSTQQREEELARMLGGVEVSGEARAAARRLLAGVD